MLSVLEEVKQLPDHVQAEIATRVGNYITEAKKADDAALNRFVGAARKEREAITAAADKPTLAQIAGPALAEAWCAAKLGLSEASMDKHCAITIIVAIEAFALSVATTAEAWRLYKQLADLWERVGSELSGPSGRSPQKQ